MSPFKGGNYGARGAGFLFTLLAASPVFGFESVKLLYDCVDGAPVDTGPSLSYSWQQEFFFRANIRAFGSRYFRSNGNPQNTVPVPEVNDGFSLASILGPLDDRFLVYARSAQYGTELSIFDPASNTMALLHDTEPGSGSGNVVTFTTAGDRWYFASSTTSFGLEFWQTDGTSAGTDLVAEVVPGPTGFTYWLVNPPCALGNRLVYFLDDQLHGLEPWLIDGPARQVRLIRDIAPGIFDSYPPAVVTSRMLSIGTRVLFTAASTTGNIQVWSTEMEQPKTRYP